MARKKFNFEITLRGAVVFSCEATRRASRGRNPRVLLVNHGDGEAKPADTWDKHCGKEKKENRMPYHYPFLTLAREDIYNPERERVYVGADGRYYVMQSLYKKNYTIAPKDDDAESTVKLSWLPLSPSGFDRPKSPTNDQGLKVHSFSAMDWSLQSQDLGIVVDEKKAISVIGLPSGKIDSSYVLRHNIDSFYKCIEWTVTKNDELVAEQAVAETLLLRGSLRQPLVVKDIDAGKDLFELDPRPRKTLRIAISNLPAFICTPKTHLNVYNAISSGPPVDLKMGKKAGFLHPAGACPHLVWLR